MFVSLNTFDTLAPWTIKFVRNGIIIARASAYSLESVEHIDAYYRTILGFCDKTVAGNALTRCVVTYGKGIRVHEEKVAVKHGLV